MSSTVFTSREKRGSKRIFLPQGFEFAPDTRGSLVGVLAVGAIVTGLAQNILLTYTSFNGFNLMDDLCMSLMFVVAFWRLLNRFNVPALMCLVWLAGCGIAFWRTLDEGIVSTDSAFFLFRQVCMPVLVIIAGMAVTRREWRWIIQVTIAIAMLNLAYIAVETLGTRLIDPTPYARLNKVDIYPNGLPGYYMGFDFRGELVVRAGGLYLNPPTTGITTGLAALVVLHTWRSRWRLPMFLAFALATLATVSRGGLLILAFGSVGMFLSRKLHPLVALPAISVPALMAGDSISDQGGSGAHVNGLVVGLQHAFDSVIGKGFGYVGNFAGSQNSVQEASESLSGIAFSAAGLLAVGLYFVAMLRIVFNIFSNARSWTQYIAFGALLIAMLAETAGSMNATVPLWLIVGAALMPQSTRKYPAAPLPTT